MKQKFLEELILYITNENIIPISLEILMTFDDTLFITMIYYIDGNIIVKEKDMSHDNEINDIYEIFNKYNIPFDSLTCISETFIPDKKILIDKTNNKRFNTFVYASDDKYILSRFLYDEDDYDNICDMDVLQLWTKEYAEIDYTTDNLETLDNI